MAMPNPQTKILQNAVNTASKEELTLMLYEGALKFCNQAIIAAESNDFNKCNELCIRVQNIIREFQITLDRSYDISKNFETMYEYMHRRTIEGNIKKDTDILSEVRDLIREFRDTWKEAIKIARVSAPAMAMR